jgi:hypothetical protein
VRKSAAERKNERIEDLIAARQGLLAAAAAIPTAQVDQPCIGFWSVKDLLAHLIGWDFTNLNAVQEILSGERPAFFDAYDKDWRTYNANLVKQYRKESISALLADTEDSHNNLVIYLKSLSVSQILEGKSPREKGRPVTIRNLLRSEAEDERRHTQQLHNFLESLSERMGG